MENKGYMQREKAALRAKRIKRVGNIIVWGVILGVPFALGVFTGHVSTKKAEPVYHPDPCGLEVVVCEGEPGYNAQ